MKNAHINLAQEGQPSHHLLQGHCDIAVRRIQMQHNNINTQKNF